MRFRQPKAPAVLLEYSSPSSSQEGPTNCVSRMLTTAIPLQTSCHHGWQLYVWVVPFSDASASHILTVQGNPLLA